MATKAEIEKLAKWLYENVLMPAAKRSGAFDRAQHTDRWGNLSPSLQDAWRAMARLILRREKRLEAKYRAVWLGAPCAKEYKAKKGH